MLWSVTAQAVGDREVTREEIVELADAVAAARGVASGIGTHAYGARLVVDADDHETALARGRELFSAAAARAGLPPWPIAEIVAVSEEDEAAAEWDPVAEHEA
jgi:hypothetical protein